MSPLTIRRTVATPIKLLPLALVTAALAVALPSPPARAQDPASPAPPPAKSVGGHVGVATSLVTVANQTETIGDRLTIASPLGVTVKINERWAVDFEVVVNNPVDPKGTTTLVRRGRFPDVPAGRR